MRRRVLPLLTKTELKLIAQELDTSHKLLPKLVAEKPWLTEISRRYLCAWGFCDKFPVFRTVGLMHLAVPEGESVSPHILVQVEAAKELRPEAIVSTTLNPFVALSIASEQADRIYWTGGMFRGGVLSTRPVVLRYEISLERVILFVPALIAYVQSIYSHEELLKTKYRNRWGERRSIPHIFRELTHREENEIIADVTGLTPEVFETDGNKTLISEARDMVWDPNFDAIERMKRRGQWGHVHPPIPGWEPPPPGPTEDQLKQVKWLNKLLKYVREFFATPWRPMPRERE